MVMLTTVAADPLGVTSMSPCARSIAPRQPAPSTQNGCQPVFALGEAGLGVVISVMMTTHNLIQPRHVGTKSPQCLAVVNMPFAQAWRRPQAGFRSACPLTTLPRRQLQRLDRPDDISDFIAAYFNPPC